MKKKLYIIIILFIIFFSIFSNVLASGYSYYNSYYGLTFSLEQKYIDRIKPAWYTDYDFFAHIWNDRLVIFVVYGIDDDTTFNTYRITNGNFGFRPSKQLTVEIFEFDINNLDNRLAYNCVYLTTTNQYSFSYNFICSFDIYEGTTGRLFYDNVYNFQSVEMPVLEWNFDRRINNIIMSSQQFSFDDINNYTLYYKNSASGLENYKEFEQVPIGSLTNTSNDTTSYFFFLTFENTYYLSERDYYFVLEHKDTGQTVSSSVHIDFKYLNDKFDNEFNETLKDNGIYSDTFFTNGVPNLKMKYTRYMNSDNSYYYEISSQSFSKYEVMEQYTAYYTNDSSIIDNFSLWNRLDIATFTNIINDTTEYYYFFNISAESEDTTYYFVLYNNKTGEYGGVSSLDLKFDKMWEYSEILSNKDDVNTRFDQLIEYLKDRFRLYYLSF